MDTTANNSEATGALAATQLVPFERMLDNDWSLAMSEGDRFLRGEGLVHETLARLAKRLDEHRIPYAVAGGMALYSHGFRRVTEGVDLIVTKENLIRLHQHLDGLGYVRPFEASKNLRDVHTKVKIEFLVTGEYPGDGKPKPISFPDPLVASERKAGLQVLSVSRLIELKIASGMTGAGRLKDLGDVEQIIKLLHIPRSQVEQLHEYVREKFLELWDSIYAADQRFVLPVRSAKLMNEVKSFESLANTMPQLTSQLSSMQRDGVLIDPRSTTAGEFTYLIVSNPEIAAKYGMQPENEILFENQN